MKLDKKESQSILILFILLLTLLLGCIQKAGVSTYEEILTATRLTFFELNNCTVFFCKNETNFLGIISIAYPRTTKCYFNTYNLLKKEDNDTLNEILSEESGYLRTFMIGQGPNIATGDSAKMFCNNSIEFMVHWIDEEWVDKNGVINESKFEKDFNENGEIGCEIEKGIIPFFAYESKSIPYAFNLSKQLETIKSPFFIAPNVKHDVVAPGLTSPPKSGEPKSWTDWPDHARDYFGQFYNIKKQCGNCMTVAYIDFNDTFTLSAFNNTEYPLTKHYTEYPLTKHYEIDLGKEDFLAPTQLEERVQEVNNVIDAIDMIAFDINLSNRKFDCDPNDVYLKIISFSRFIASNYKKPMIIASVKGKPETITKSDGSRCEWTDKKIGDFLTLLYSGIPEFVESGIIGMAIEDSTVFFDENLNKTQSFYSWFRACQYYHGPVDPSREVGLLFPKSGGGRELSPCNRQDVSSPGMFFITFKDDYSIFEDNIIPTENIDKNRKIIPLCGDVCFDGVNVIGITSVPVPDKNKYCWKYEPLVRDFSYRKKVDPSVIRALIWDGSDFSAIDNLMNPGPHPGVRCFDCDDFSGRIKNVCCGIDIFKQDYDFVKKEKSDGKIPEEKAPECCIKGVPSIIYPYDLRGGADVPEYQDLYLGIGKYMGIKYRTMKYGMLQIVENYENCVAEKCCVIEHEKKDEEGNVIYTYYQYNCPFEFADQNILQTIGKAIGLRETCGFCQKV